MHPLLRPIVLTLSLAGMARAQTDDVLYEVSVQKILMGTTVETTARHADILRCKQAIYRAYREMERIEGVFSSYRPESDISRINRAAGDHPVRVSAETFTLLQQAVADARRLDGLVDVTVGPLTELWGLGTDEPVRAVPPRDAIKARRRLVDFRAVLFDSLQNTVLLRDPGARLDLGGIAKAYAVHRATLVLKEQGISRFILKAGGDIYASGQKEDGRDWRVGVQHPREKDSLIARFDMKDYAVSTSGDYERYVILDGRRYHHIVDPRTGYPGALSRSATVLAPTPEEADAMAKYLFLLGYEKAMARKDLTLPFLLVAQDGSLHYNEAFSRLPGLEMPVKP